jgi:hypothetical protein
VDDRPLTEELPARSIALFESGDLADEKLLFPRELR